MVAIQILGQFWLNCRALRHPLIMEFLQKRPVHRESGLLLIKAKKSPSWCCIEDFQTQMSSSSTLVQEYFTRCAKLRMEKIVRKSCFAKCLEFNHLLNLPPKLDNTLEASTAYSNTLYNRLNTD